MAEKKTAARGGAAKKSAPTHAKTKKASSSPKGRNSPSGKETAVSRRESRASSQFIQFFLIVTALVLAIFIYLESLSGSVGGAIGGFFKGLFAGGAFCIPLVLVLVAIRWRRDAEDGYLLVRTLCGTGSIIFFSAFLHIVTGGSITYNIPVLFSDGTALRGGGFFGGIIGSFMWTSFKVAAPVIICAGLLLLIPMMFGLTPKGLYILIAYKHKTAKEKRDAARERTEAEEAERVAALSAARKQKRSDAPQNIPAKTVRSGEQIALEDDYVPPVKKKKSRADFEADVPMPDGDVYEDIAPEVDEGIFEGYDFADDDTSPADTRISDKIDSYDEEDTVPDFGAETTAVTGAVVADTASALSPETIAEIADFAESAPAVAMTDGTSEDGAVDLKSIFSDPSDEELFDRLCAAYMDDGEGVEGEAELNFTRDTVSTPKITVADDEEEELPPVPEYRFPPLNLLTPDNSEGDPGVMDELRENAKKLVDTLRSFNVKTKIVDISRGPTITRYELMPEAGTKVRTIANLTDDIALAFAVKGVRIEAPVPGKSAVGIEVPNKTAATVHLRSLLEDSRFTDAKSKLNTALGEDVAGESVYLDISKMPHLLIAGATGMGKSVCINCLIVSLLYKADPDEVKLILIDPKKVEFSLYSGLPHLLVPVVTDPKKAAGSLSWAVSEMERRFNLLEGARVRDIAKYNAIAKMEEGREVLPQIVIIIDELADLMMTASDDVETSICRLAQKARAAGMHLIIGTQRPSVDVITGLIKNNIPSRISCAVTSQADSRTILDRSGAEKLIGRGDMLYKPVGIDPIRVQGAFVSETEVEAVVEFIKNQNTEKTETYSEEVIEQIEREAERCGISGKKKAADAADSADSDGAEDDPMLRAALELAVDSRKISTSLIQRKLSLGYGRAAKLIDRMEQLGYVSAPDGQKPRDVLISKQEFMEMVLRNEE